MGGKRVDYAMIMGLYIQGLNDADIAKAVGCKTGSVRKWRWDNCLAPNTPSVRNGNPCGECAYPIVLCPWLGDGKPVPGWNAKKAEYKLHEKTVMTFAITSCPLYIAHEKIRKSEGHSDTKN